MYIVIIVSILGLTVAGALSIYFPGQVIGNVSLGILTSGIYSIIIAIIYRLKTIDKLTLPAKKAFLASLMPNRYIRVSMSYLYKIEIDGKYLLMTNTTWGNITPIGGVYKSFDSARTFLTSIKASPEYKAKQNTYEDYSNDLRIIFPIRKFVIFMNWFKRGLDREYEANREWREEIVDSGIISDSEVLRDIRYSKYTSHQRMQSYDANKKYYSYHYFDIFRVDLSPIQKKTLIAAVDHCIKEYKNGSTRIPTGLFLATPEEIRNGQLDIGIRLGNNCAYILPLDN